MRMCEYYHKVSTKSIFYRLIYIYYLRKHNKNCIKYGLQIGHGVFDEGLLIYHTGNIVVNGYTKVGKNCHLHGSNVIGNIGPDDQTGCPVIGDNVMLGAGAMVLGKVRIADNIKIAAGAVVIHSFDEPGITIAGIPARKVSK